MIFLVHRLKGIGACEGAMKWVRSLKSGNLRAAWNACPRSDWLLWLAWHLDVDDTAIHAAAIAVAPEVDPSTGWWLGNDETMRADGIKPRHRRNAAAVRKVISFETIREAARSEGWT